MQPFQQHGYSSPYYFAPPIAGVPVTGIPVMAPVSSVMAPVSSGLPPFNTARREERQNESVAQKVQRIIDQSNSTSDMQQRMALRQVVDYFNTVKATNARQDYERQLEDYYRRYFDHYENYYKSHYSTGFGYQSRGFQLSFQQPAAPQVFTGHVGFFILWDGASNLQINFTDVQFSYPADRSATVTCGPLVKSSPVSNSTNPQWTEPLLFQFPPNQNVADRMTLRLMEGGVSHTTDLLLSTVQPGRSQWQWDVHTREVRHVSHEPFGTPVADRGPVGSTPYNYVEMMAKYTGGVLALNVSTAHLNVPPTHKTYLTLEVDGVEKKSPVKMGSSPAYNHYFEFTPKSEESRLKMRVFRKRKVGKDVLFGQGVHVIQDFTPDESKKVVILENDQTPQTIIEGDINAPYLEVEFMRSRSGDLVVKLNRGLLNYMGEQDPDPFVQVSVATDFKRSQVINNRDYPVWNETMAAFRNVSDNDNVNFILLEKNRVHSDVRIAGVAIPMIDIPVSDVMTGPYKIQLLKNFPPLPINPIPHGFSA